MSEGSSYPRIASATPTSADGRVGAWRSSVIVGVVIAAAAASTVVAFTAWWVLTRPRRRNRNARTRAYNPVLIRSSPTEVTTRKAKLQSLEPLAPGPTQPSHAIDAQGTEVRRLREAVAVLNTRLRGMEIDKVSESLPMYDSLNRRV